MIALLVTLIVALVVVSIALWAVGELAPTDLQRPLRVVVIALFLIYVLVRLLPMLGVR